MDIEAELKKDGIEIIAPLDRFSIHSIANTVAEKLCVTFPNMHFSYQILFQRLSSLSMYVANMPVGVAEACYYYKNSSIYFRDGMGLSEIEKFAIHECIHHLQEQKNNKNQLIRLGFYHVSEIKSHGMGLNEAAVQYITSRALGENIDTVKYYGLSFSTISPSYYPLLCNLIEQLIAITGEDCLIESTFENTDTFKNMLVQLLGEKNFVNLEKNFDHLLSLEENITKLSGKQFEESITDKQIEKYNRKIIKQKNALKKLFLETQKLILTSYFDHELERVISASDADFYRHSLYNFKDLLAIAENEDSFFNTYYIEQMAKLDARIDAISNNVYLVATSESKLAKLFNFFRKLLFKNGNEYEKG